MNVRYREALDRSCGCKAGDGVQDELAALGDSKVARRVNVSSTGILHLLRSICGGERNEENGPIEQ